MSVNNIIYPLPYINPDSSGGSETSWHPKMETLVLENTFLCLGTGIRDLACEGVEVRNPSLTTWADVAINMYTKTLTPICTLSLPKL